MLIKDFQTRYHYNTKTDILGRGGFAIVYKANDTLLGRTVALKFFTKSDNDRHTLIKEISRVISLEHPNLCRYYDAALLESLNLHGETNETEVGVMEFLDGGDLKSYCIAHPEHLNTLLADVLRGISFLHSRGIIHRDLKPQNILIKNTDNGPVAKITDFGISKDIGSGDTSNSLLMGTIEYMAPEQFSPVKYGVNGSISTSLDYWSFGLIVYELVTGGNLFGSRGGNSTAEQVMGNILNDDLIEEKIGHLPEPYRFLATKCLVRNANLRVQHPEEMINQLTATGTMVFDKIVTPFTRGAAVRETTVISRPVETMVIPKKTADRVALPLSEKGNKKMLLFGAVAVVVLIVFGTYLFIDRDAQAKPQKNTADSSAAMAANKDTASQVLAKKPVETNLLPAVKKENGALKQDLRDNQQVLIPPGKELPAAGDNAIIKSANAVAVRKEYQETGNYFDGMATVEDGGKWGYIDESGKEIIPLIYDDASPFSGGFAAVTKSGKVGYIDKTGKEVIPLIYSASGPFSGGLAMVNKGGKKGYIDPSGREVIPLIYDDISPFVEGLAKVKTGGKFGFIDRNGITIIPLIYDYANSFAKGKAMVKKDGIFSYIDKSGNVLTDK